MIKVSFCKVLYHKLLMHQRPKGVSLKQNHKMSKLFTPVLAIRNIFNNNIDIIIIVSIILVIMVVVIIFFVLFCLITFVS